MEGDWNDEIDALVNPKATYDRQQAAVADQAPPRGKGMWDDDIDSLLDPKWQDKQLAAARQKQESQGEGVLERIARRSIPFVSAIQSADETSRYAGARSRYAAGTATGTDLDLIAHHEGVQREAADRGIGGKAIDALLGVPAMAGEAAMTGGAGGATGLLGRAAGMAARTPLRPSFFLPSAAERAAEQGGEWYEPKNLIPPLTYGAIQSAVLGSLGGVGQGITNPVGRFATRVGVGVGEITGADFAADAVNAVLPKAYQAKTPYGAIGMALKGEWGEAAQKLFTDAVVMSAFAALHMKGREEAAPETPPPDNQPPSGGPGQPPPGSQWFNPDDFKQGQGGGWSYQPGEGKPPPGPSGSQSPPPGPQGRVEPPPPPPGPKTWNRLYETLGVDPKTSPADIAAAYRRVVKDFHPDRGGDPDILKAANHAYDVLKDPVRRARYDQMGKGDLSDSFFSAVQDAYVKARRQGYGPDKAAEKARQVFNDAAADVGQASQEAQPTQEAAQQAQPQPTPEPPPVAPESPQPRPAPQPAPEATQAHGQPEVIQEPPVEAQLVAPKPPLLDKIRQRQAQQKPIQTVTAAPPGEVIVPPEMKLDAREQDVLDARKRGDSLKTIGNRIGLTREGVRLIEKTARAKLGQAESIAKEQARQKVERAAELVARQDEYNPGDVGVNPADLTRRVRKKLSVEERAEQKADKLRDQWITEKENGTLTPASSLGYESRIRDLSRIAQGLPPAADQPDAAVPQAAAPSVPRAAPAESPWAIEPTRLPEAALKQISEWGNGQSDWTRAYMREVLGEFGLDDPTIDSLVSKPKSGYKADKGGIGETLVGANAQARSAIVKGSYRVAVAELIAPQEVADARAETGKAAFPTSVFERRVQEANAEAQRLARREVEGEAGEPPSGSGSDTGADYAGDPGGFDPAELDATLNGPAGPLIRDAARVTIHPSPGRSGQVQIPVEEIVRGVHYTMDFLRRLSGKAFPATTAIDRESGEAMMRYAASRTYAQAATEYFKDLVLGDKTPEAFRRLVGATDMERRFRYAEMVFNATGRPQQAVAVTSFVGKQHSPLQTQVDFQAAQQNPAVIAALKRYEQHFVGPMEHWLRQALGIPWGQSIPGGTQMPGHPIYAKAVRDGDPNAAQAVFTGTGAGSMKAQKLRKPSSANEFAGASDHYEIDMGRIIEHTVMDRVPKAAKAEMYRTLERNGLGVWGRTGGQLDGWVEIPDVDPPRHTQASQTKDTSFYVRKEIAGEFKNAIAVDRIEDWEKGLRVLTTLPTIGALASSVEAATHGLNLLNGIFAPRMIRHVFQNAYGKWRRDPAWRKKVIELARIGAMKAPGMESGTILGPLQSAVKFMTGKTLPITVKGWPLDPTHYASKLLDGIGEIVRTAAADAFDDLARSGHAPSTETAKRDFINQMAGQYEKRGQPGIIRVLRNTGIGPFATAASTMTVRSLRMVVAGSPGTPATGLKSSVFMRAEVYAKIAASLGAVFALNYARWGRWDGDDLTPFGALKLGEKNGKTIYLPTPTSLATRALRSMGLMAIIDGMRQGKTKGEIIDRVAKDVALAILSPADGPIVRFVNTILFGQDLTGHHLAEHAKKGKNQMALNAKAAFANANPAVASLTGLDTGAKERERQEWYERASKLLGPLGPKFRSHRHR